MSFDQFEAAFHEYMHDRIIGSQSFEDKVKNTLIRDIATPINNLILEAHDAKDCDQYQNNLVDLLAGVTAFTSTILSLVINTAAKPESRIGLTDEVVKELRERIITMFNNQDVGRASSIRKAVEQASSVEETLEILRSRSKGQ